MGRKAKEGSVNLYYLKNQNDNKSVSKKENRKKQNNNGIKKRNNQTQKPKQDKFNFDDEIVIGVTKIAENKKKTNSKNKQSKNKVKKVSTKPKNVQAKKKNNKSKTKNFKMFKYIFIICILFSAIICFMLSPIFNIAEIKVLGNNNISADEIISISKIKIGENTYKINKKEIISNIKQNAYIEGVTIKRNIPNLLEITVKERQATYMLEYVNSYAYVNNQGYMLEISDTKIDKPILTGITTQAEDIKVGNRLVEEDLIKLENVLKIMESAISNEIEMLITKIDMSNYILYMDTEGKIVRLGDITDISTKMLHVKAILEKEAGVEGEIIVESVPENGKSRFIQKIN